MREALLVVLIPLVGACTGDDPERRRRPAEDSATSTGLLTGLTTGTPGGTTTGTTTTTPWTTTFDCANRPQMPFAKQEFAILTEEDFSFDQSGHLVYQQGTLIMGADTSANASVLATGAPGDPAGLDVIADHKLLIAGPNNGSLMLLDLVTGAGDTILSSLSQPNTVLGGRDGLYYVSELNSGRARWFDPVLEVAGPVITDTGTANGLALSPDEQTLYSGGSETIWAVDRDPVTGAWDPTTQRAFYTEPGRSFFTMDVDVCGWIYTVGYNDGNAIRISPDGLTVEPVGQLGNGWSWGGMNFGSGLGGWDEDWVYFTNRSKIVGVDVGIPGVPGPSAMP